MGQGPSKCPSLNLVIIRYLTDCLLANAIEKFSHRFANETVLERHLADMRATVEQLAASQDQMAREIEKLQAADTEILEKITTPPPKRAPLPRASPRR
jgi:hypothetical protein